MRRQPPPLDARLEADRVVTAELLAAASLQPLDLAARYCDIWFRVARLVAESNVVLVFDELVLGPPCPLLLEAADHVRETRRAEHLGRFDDEEEHWYDEHGDDPDAFWEPPTTTDRVLAAMASGQESDRLVDGVVVSRVALRALDLPIEQWVSFVQLGMTMKRLLVELADGIRVGHAVVVDARLPGEVRDGWRWAA